MLSIPSTSPRATVFTAPVTALYCFVVDGANGTEDFRVNGSDSVTMVDVASGQRAFNLVLQASDTLDYLGPAISLYGGIVGYSV